MLYWKIVNGKHVIKVVMTRSLSKERVKELAYNFDKLIDMLTDRNPEEHVLYGESYIELC